MRMVRYVSRKASHLPKIQQFRPELARPLGSGLPLAECLAFMRDGDVLEPSTKPDRLARSTAELTSPIAVFTSRTAATASPVEARIAVIWAADIFGRLGGLLGQFFHLVGHHRQALAGLSRASRLDRGVQCQKVGLLRDRGDDLDHVADPISRRHAAHLGVRDVGALHRSAHRLCHASDLLADLVDAGRHLLRRRREGAKIGCRGARYGRHALGRKP